MGFFEYLEKVRQKSDSEKRSISFLFAFFITLVIAIVWIFGTFYSFNNMVKSDNQNSPAKTMMDSFKSIFNN
ncbi:MAG TPA: hypothetical protein PKA60_02255 [Candidatus Paceibacterota bacterium]|nr:hypothetical protein [Candidatus Paceibacterota bacterium]